MSLVDLMAVESVYRNNKNAYDHMMLSLNHSNDVNKEKVDKTAQMNVDLQTSLLSMSNLLPPAAVEQFSLLRNTETLENEFEKLVSDSRTVTDMFQARYFVWLFFAFVVFVVMVRQSLHAKSMS